MSEGLEQDDFREPLCETCGELMTFIRATPKVGALAALETFSCIKCGDVRAIEVEEQPVPPSSARRTIFVTSLNRAEPRLVVASVGVPRAASAQKGQTKKAIRHTLHARVRSGRSI